MRTTSIVRVAGAGVLVALLLAGCGQQTPPSGLRVLGSDMGDRYQNVLVTRDGTPVTTATVTVNGTQLALANPARGRYYGVLPSKLPAGSQLDLVVADGSQRVEAKGEVPETPVITAPAAGATIDATMELTVTWTSTTSPDAFELLVYQSGSSPVYDASMDGSSRTANVPANSLDTGYANGSLEVFAYNHGYDQITGDAAPGSAMNIRAERGITISTSP